MVDKRRERKDADIVKKAPPAPSNTFYAFFQNAIGTSVVLTLKDGIKVAGTLVVLDPQMNVYLENMTCVNEEAQKHNLLKAMKSLVFFRGSSIAQIQFEKNTVNCAALAKFCTER